MVDGAADKAGAKSIINIDDADVGGTTIQHPKKSGQTPKTRSVASARGHTYNGYRDQSANDTWQSPSHPSYADDDTRTGELLPVLQ